MKVASTSADQKAWKLGEKEGGVILAKLLVKSGGKVLWEIPLLINLDPSQSLVYALLGKPPDTQDQQRTVKFVFFSPYTSGQSGMKNTRNHFVLPSSIL